MGRLIDADVYADEMRKRQNKCEEHVREAKSEEERCRWNGVFATFVEAKLTLDNAPTVDAEPVRHGVWKRDVVSIIAGIAEFWKCSECGEVFADKTNYCPSCGTKMDGGTDDAENRA